MPLPSEHSPSAPPHRRRSSPDIAVVIPAFNAARYLDQTLASIAAQTVPPAEVVVADDGSTDDTVDRAREWKGRLPIKVVQLPGNAGPGPARHAAILASEAPLLAIIDADDFWLPDHLETMRAAYGRSPGLVSAQHYAWMEGRGIDTALHRIRSDPIPTGDAQLFWLMRENNMKFPVFSRALYEDAGGFRARFRIGEDWDLWIRMVRTGATITENSHPTALYRIRSDSLSANPEHLVDHRIAVLRVAMEEAASPVERQAAEQGLAGLQGRKRYYRALALASQGQRFRARLEAARGLGSSDGRVRLALAAITATPGLFVRLEKATRRYRVFRPE